MILTEPFSLSVPIFIKYHSCRSSTKPHPYLHSYVLSHTPSYTLLTYHSHRSSLNITLFFIGAMLAMIFPLYHLPSVQYTAQHDPRGSSHTLRGSSSHPYFSSRCSDSLARKTICKSPQRNTSVISLCSHHFKPHVDYNSSIFSVFLSILVHATP